MTWAVVDEAPQYVVSDDGRVARRMADGSLRPLKAFPVTSGHLSVGLYPLPRNKVTRHVHALVARAFLGPAPEGLEVRHLDGDKAHNGVENLAYGTRSENVLDRVRHGTHHEANKTHCPKGHPYSPENTYYRPDRRPGTGRMCRVCRAGAARRNTERR
ncbi:MAG TPA: HNH endonuclease signature motif containing protein [Phytomonospora sp.]